MKPDIDYGPHGVFIEFSHGPFHYQQRMGTVEVDKLIEQLKRAKAAYRQEHGSKGDS